MGFIKKYKVIIAIVLPILILVLIRSFGVNHFKTDAKKWIEPSVLQSNIITGEQFANLPGDKLIINLGKEVCGIDKGMSHELKMAVDSVLDKRNLKIIRKHVGPVLLFSSETTVSARVWMILSQLGCKNIFILTNNPDNESQKNKFRPDTLVRPEL